MSLAYMLLFARLGYFSFDAARALPAIAAVAALATVTESLPINQRIDDNVSVPGAALLLGCWLLHGL